MLVLEREEYKGGKVRTKERWLFFVCFISLEIEESQRMKTKKTSEKVGWAGKDVAPPTKILAVRTRDAHFHSPPNPPPMCPK